MENFKKWRRFKPHEELRVPFEVAEGISASRSWVIAPEEEGRIVLVGEARGVRAPAGHGAAPGQVRDPPQDLPRRRWPGNLQARKHHRHHWHWRKNPSCCSDTAVVEVAEGSLGTCGAGSSGGPTAWVDAPFPPAGSPSALLIRAPVRAGEIPGGQKVVLSEYWKCQGPKLSST